MTVLRIVNLGKAYRNYSNELKRIARWFGMVAKPSEENWVIRNINFDLNEGEAVGIIGQNGAGKSTLLKIITGTLQPTHGEVCANGRIAAILELGMGFNPELTGRENVKHSAGLMGFNADQIEEAMPAIEAFAEIGEYFDQPVRTYSSGMNVRVAFAVAIAWRPDILIIDEALSVGDTYFQHKSFAKIREFKSNGTTLLLVSHDRSAVQSLCDRAILIDKGSLIKDGIPEEIFDYYNALIADRENVTVKVNKGEDGKARTISGTGEARVQNISLCNKNGDEIEQVAVGESVELHVRVKVFEPIETLVLGYGIKDRLGQVMYGTNTWHTKQVLYNIESGSEYLFNLAFNIHLGVGSYSLQIALTNSDTHLSKNFEWREMALIFDVINIDKTQFVGCLWNEPEIQIKKILI